LKEKNGEVEKKEERKEEEYYIMYNMIYIL